MTELPRAAQTTEVLWADPPNRNPEAGIPLRRMEVEKEGIQRRSFDSFCGTNLGKATRRGPIP